MSSQSSRTCDRCYRIKGRCAWNAAGSQCERCERLGHPCTTQRAVLRPGRPRRHPQKPATTTAPSLPAAASISDQHGLLGPLTTSWTPPLASVVEGFDVPELLSLEFVLHPDHCRSFIYGMSFLSDLQSAFFRQVISKPKEIKDGFFACAGALAIAQGLELPWLGDHGRIQGRSCRALQILRNTAPGSLEDAQLAVSLALILLSYNDMAGGQPSLAITRSALLLAKPWSGVLSQLASHEAGSHLVCILFAEMAECLLRGQIPVFRYEPRSDGVKIDRYYGLCHELLPFFYDVCVLQHILKEGLVPDSIQDHVRATAEAVQNWNPESRISLHGGPAIADYEADHVLFQAQCFKRTALIFLYRMDPSFDAFDRRQCVALQLRNDITAANDQGFQGLRYLLFPYFVAHLELQATVDTPPDKEGFCHTNGLSNQFATLSCQSMANFLQYAWESRRVDADVSWSDLVEKGPPLSIGP